MTKQDLTDASGVMEWAEFESSGLAEGCRCMNCYEFDNETAEYIAKCVEFYQNAHKKTTPHWTEK